MSSELEELGEYILKILEKIKETESRVQKLEDSVDSIGKVIEEATEEVQTEEKASNTAPSVSFRLWAPLNAVKWLGVCLTIFSIASIRGRMSVAAWSQVIPSDFTFWNMVDGIIASASLAAAAGIEIFLFWRERIRRRPSPIVKEGTDSEEVQQAQALETQENAEAPSETEEKLIDNEEVEEEEVESPIIDIEEIEETSLETPPIEEGTE